jgi:hypothetical protein
MNIKQLGYGLVFGVLGMPGLAQADETKAIFLNGLYGDATPQNPLPVKLEVINGKAKGCIIEGQAVLNKRHRRYEYTLQPPQCVHQGQKVAVGTLVRGQHNIPGTMANSGMGRGYWFSNKGLIVTLSEQ